jgi:pimeloyl-ACP methyl ester carboxylesterase
MAESVGGRPQTRYARSGDVNVAYQVIGDAALDLVLVPGWVSNVEASWEEPSCARFLRRLASFSRLVLFDKRGTGLSDRIAELPTLEQRIDDVRAVTDAVGSGRAALCGYSEGGPMCALFAATHPARCTGLIMIGSYARRLRDDDYPWGLSAAQHEAWLHEIQSGWGGRWAWRRELRASPRTSASGSGGRATFASPPAPGRPRRWRA